MHLLGAARPEDDGRRVAVHVHVADVCRALTAADRGRAAHLVFKLADQLLHNGALNGDLGGLGKVAGEDDLGRIVLEPGILGADALGDEADEIRLDGLGILARHGRHRALEHTAVGEGAVVGAAVELADGTGDGARDIGIERMRDLTHAQRLVLLHSLADEIAEVDAADALAVLLDAGGLALDVDGEPDPADRAGLDAHAGGLAADAGVGLVALHDAGQRAVARQLLVHDVFHDQIALEPDAAGLDGADRHRHGGGAGFHVGGAAAVHFAVRDIGRPGVMLPVVERALGDNVDVAVEQQRPAAARALQRADDIRTALIGLRGCNICRVLLQLLERRNERVDRQAHFCQRFGHKFLDRAFIAGDAGDADHLLEKFDLLLLMTSEPGHDSLFFHGCKLLFIENTRRAACIIVSIAGPIFGFIVCFKQKLNLTFVSLVHRIF